MRDTENERKRELECLRLASDLRQLGRNTLDPRLRAHCERMAEIWSDHSRKNPGRNISVQSVSYH